MSNSDIIDTFELQLSEIELLQSMFPSESEFCLDDPSAVWDLRNYVDAAAEGRGLGKYRLPADLLSCDDGHALGMSKEASSTSGSGSGTEDVDDSELICLRQVSFVLKVKVTASEDKDRHALEVQCTLPLDYPKAMPEVNVQSNNLSRPQYKALNDATRAYLESLDRGEICITEIIHWLQESAVDYLAASSIPDKDAARADVRKGLTSAAPSSFTRLWIHSHHIYSRSKREDICAWARERELTGFSLPGKPGVVCVEGPREDVDEFWHKLRRLNWKKLTSKHREDFALGNNLQTLDGEATFKRHFADFQEINFAVRGSRDYHMDLGQFFQYLEDHGCSDVFKILLGVDGRVSQKGTS